MSTGGGPSRGPPGGIPTLTEVVPWPGPTPAAPVGSGSAPVLPAAPSSAPVTSTPPAALPPPAAPALAAAPVAAAAVAASVVPAAQAAPVGESELTQRILADLQRQIDLMLEVRLREALAPVLSRAADALIRDARKELTVALRDAVARSVAQELARRQDR